MNEQTKELEAIAEKLNNEFPGKWEDYHAHMSFLVLEMLGEASKEIEGFGVEAIFGKSNGIDGTGTVSVEYINMGDSDVATLVFDYEEKKFRVSSWSDEMERLEAKDMKRLEFLADQMNEAWADRLRHYEDREESDFVAIHNMLNDVSTDIGGTGVCGFGNKHETHHYVERNKDKQMPTILFDARANKFIIGTPQEFLENLKKTFQFGQAIVYHPEDDKTPVVGNFVDIDSDKNSIIMKVKTQNLSFALDKGRIEVLSKEELQDRNKNISVRSSDSEHGMSVER
jgi:hypothetical protein